MLVRQARAVASRWVAEHAVGRPGFVGAFLTGSATWLPGDAELPATSDVDVMVVTAGERTRPKLGKFLCEGVVVEVTYLPWDAVGSAERVLGSYHLAGCLRGGTIVSDPAGRLAEVQAVAAGQYARRAWVRRRCQDAERRVVDGLAAVDAGGPWHDQVTAWSFATGVTTHVLLTAGLRNPTVRLRYLAVRALLLEHGRLGFHEELLELLGCARLDRVRVEQHLRVLAGVFDATVPVSRTWFPFSADDTPVGRPMAIEGSRELVERGLHREAVFWIVATYARCLKILASDAPETRELYSPGFTDLLADLGVTSPADLRRRAADVRAFLPRLREVAESIMAVNPRIQE
jgi:hypothetical protein